jgi:hypothetical protein
MRRSALRRMTTFMPSVPGRPMASPWNTKIRHSAAPFTINSATRRRKVVRHRCCARWSPGTAPGRRKVGDRAPQRPDGDPDVCLGEENPDFLKKKEFLKTLRASPWFPEPINAKSPLKGALLLSQGRMVAWAGFAPAAFGLWSAGRGATIASEDEVFAPAILSLGRGKIGCGGRI